VAAHFWEPPDASDERSPPKDIPPILDRNDYEFIVRIPLHVEGQFFLIRSQSQADSE
jgi:hypothetical protein